MKGSWALLLLALAPLAQADDNFCRADEKVMFSCSSGEKLISVCTSADLGPNAGYIQLRFGKPGGDLIAWPEARYPREFVTKGELMYAGAKGVYMRFTMENTGFVVYSTKGPRGFQGLVIEQNRLVAKKYRCTTSNPETLWSAPVPVNYMISVSGL